MPRDKEAISQAVAENRIRRVLVQAALLEDLIRTRRAEHLVDCEGIPEDAAVIHVNVSYPPNNAAGVLTLLVACPSWEPAEFGYADFPIFDPVYSTHEAVRVEPQPPLSETSPIEALREAARKAGLQWT